MNEITNYSENHTETNKAPESRFRKILHGIRGLILRDKVLLFVLCSSFILRLTLYIGISECFFR